jgi:hypothetical protein
VVRLAVELLQFVLEVYSHGPHDLLKPHEVTAGEHGMPVLSNENQYACSPKRQYLPSWILLSVAVGRLYWLRAASLLLPPVPRRRAACGAGAGVRVRADGVQRRARRAQGGIRGRGAVHHQRGTVGAAHQVQGHPGVGVAARGLGRDLAERAGGPERGLPEFL